MPGLGLDKGPQVAASVKQADGRASDLRSTASLSSRLLSLSTPIHDPAFVRSASSSRKCITDNRHCNPSKADSRGFDVCCLPTFIQKLPVVASAAKQVP